MIELLAVIAILAILLIIAIPSVIKMYNNAKVNTFVDEVQSVINTAEKQYMSDQIGSSAPTCYSNDETIEEECDPLDLSGNKNLKYYVKFEDGHIIKAQVDNGSHAWDSGNLEKVEASSVKAGDVDSENANGKIELTNTPSIPDPVSFATDSWATIQKAVKSGDYPYEVGATRCVDLNENGDGFTTTNSNGCSDGQFLVRVANKSECANGETSETACGFVLEFVDIIENHNMNSERTNVGGWRDSEMRTYVNGTLFNALPSDLQEVISDTTVVSGHGDTSGEENFTTTDKLYLLSLHEIFGEDEDSEESSYDTAWNTTRQLDYYHDNNVTTSNYSLAFKQYNGEDYAWFLRSAFFDNNGRFIIIFDGGDGWNGVSALLDVGLSAAFRIGE